MTGREDTAAAIAREHFGIDGHARALPGEFDLNFRVSSPGRGHGRHIVLKLSPESRRPVFDLVTGCLDHLDGASLSASIPRLVRPEAAGHGQRSPIVRVDFEGEPYVAAALTFVDGIPLAELRPRSMAVLEALGALLAELNLALDGFDHPELAREFGWRMESAPETIRAHLDFLDGGRELVEATLARARSRLDTVHDALPTCVIHNDANDYNVMVVPSLDGARLAGLIDFGDVVRSWRAAEIGVAAAYSMMGLADPVEAACAIARGYSSVTPLGADECRAIIPIVALRLCLSVSVQSRQMREQPDNEYLAVSQKCAWKLLRVLARIDWRLVEFRVREACGLAPNPGVEAVASWIARARPRAPLMAPELLERPCVIDLSAGSLDLPHPDVFAREGTAEAWVEGRIAAAGATVGVGRYGEARLLYDDPAFAAPGNDGPESRTVHLGLDLFAPAGTPVHAPLAGTVLSAVDNDRPLDYGPTVILRHLTGDGTGFHTLYGHLDHPTLEHLTPGRQVGAGEVLGWLGNASVNGGWPPHLHVQVIALDPLHEMSTAPAPGNFPGVALHRLRTVWESVLPDPTSLAGLPATQRSPATPPSYAKPVHVVRGLGAYLYDDTGRRYLDTVNNGGSASAGWATRSGPSSCRAWCPTSSPWASPWGTATHRRRGDDPRDRGLLRQRHGVLQHIRGQPRVVRGGAGRPGRDPGPRPRRTGAANRAREMGVFLSVDGPDHNVLKIKPPMVFGEEEAALLLETLDAVPGESALHG